MYISKIDIRNIRSLKEFTMEFPKGNEAGWHVLIGDNGSGKSSIVRCIAAALIGPNEIGALRQYWDEWLSQGADTGGVELAIIDGKRDQLTLPFNIKVKCSFELERDADGVVLHSVTDTRRNVISEKGRSQPNNYFSASFGPFRRFTGGSSEWSKVYRSAPNAGAHLSVFGEDVALTEAMEWLKELDRRRLKEKESSDKQPSRSAYIFDKLRDFINTSKLLPHNTVFTGINLDGEPEFRDGNGSIVRITQLSDGYRSILSMTFELIRQLALRSYSIFDVPGVVLIDEIDAHLHPTWQTRIGEWFTRHFPKIQFIVTTHSPLICRACENGTIWRLSAPGSGQPSGELTGPQRDRLIYGNILDAYGTQVFGSDTSRSDVGNRKFNRLAELNMKSITGLITEEEEVEYNRLQSIFSSGK
ncbi:MAG: AAA family ATPase [Bacteroidota bacterium]